ncbi:DNA glycosylase family protein [Mycobacterium kiyosense]|uniref:hypothetical protein n=1 Tax=Mycobacterium kiyosense TaxID=2871094 RepID=UPI001F4776B4|nr:hypothetical protein [Mycobacterium kiyosense]
MVQANSTRKAQPTRTVTADNVMTDHPSWQTHGDIRIRCIRDADSVWLITCEPAQNGQTRVCYEALQGAGTPPEWTLFDCTQLGGATTMGHRLRAMKVVARWRNTDLWDALATSIIRQVIRAAHARRLYTAMCAAFGPHFDTKHGATAAFPDAHTVLALTDTDLTELGLNFKRDVLRAAAQAYLAHGQHWATLPHSDLVEALTAVRRVGEWTARATVADYSNDFALYPYGDLAVRTWAAAMDADTSWPATDAAFAQAWKNMAQADLSAWTVSTLAFGALHGRRAAPGARTRTGAAR